MKIFSPGILPTLVKSGLKNRIHSQIKKPSKIFIIWIVKILYSSRFCLLLRYLLTYKNMMLYQSSLTLILKISTGSTTDNLPDIYKFVKEYVRLKEEFCEFHNSCSAVISLWNIIIFNEVFQFLLSDNIEDDLLFKFQKWCTDTIRVRIMATGEFYSLFFFLKKLQTFSSK